MERFPRVSNTISSLSCVNTVRFLAFLGGVMGRDSIRFDSIRFDSIRFQFWNEFTLVMSPPLTTVNSEVATTKVYPFSGF